MNDLNKKIMVYPFSYRCSSIVRQMLYEKRYNIVSIVTMSRWCPDDTDAAYFDSLSDMGINLSNDFESEINNVDTVLWLEVEKRVNDLLYNKIKQKICKALDCGKNVICFNPLSGSEQKMFWNIAHSNRVSFEYNMSSVCYDESDRSTDSMWLHEYRQKPER